MRHLVRQRRRVALGIPERLEGRHLHIVGAFGVVGAGAAVADDGTGRGKEPVGALDVGDRQEGRGSALAVYWAGKPSHCSALNTVHPFLQHNETKSDVYNS